MQHKLNRSWWGNETNENDEHRPVMLSFACLCSSILHPVNDLTLSHTWQNVNQESMERGAAVAVWGGTAASAGALYAVVSFYWARWLPARGWSWCDTAAEETAWRRLQLGWEQGPGYNGGSPRSNDAERNTLISIYVLHIIESPKSFELTRISEFQSSLSASILPASKEGYGH